MYKAICTKCGKQILVPSMDLAILCPVCRGEMEITSLHSQGSCCDD